MVALTHLLRGGSRHQPGDILPNLGVGSVEIGRVHEGPQHQVQSYRPGGGAAPRIRHFSRCFLSPMVIKAEPDLPPLFFFQGSIAIGTVGVANVYRRGGWG